MKCTLLITFFLCVCSFHCHFIAFFFFVVVVVVGPATTLCLHCRVNKLNHYYSVSKCGVCFTFSLYLWRHSYHHFCIVSASLTLLYNFIFVFLFRLFVCQLQYPFHSLVFTRFWSCRSI